MDPKHAVLVGGQQLVGPFDSRDQISEFARKLGRDEQSFPTTAVHLSDEDAAVVADLLEAQDDDNYRRIAADVRTSIDMGNTGMRTWEIISPDEALQTVAG